MTVASRLLVLLTVIATLSISARAEEVVLTPRYRAGDTYALALHMTTETEFRSGSSKRQPVHDEVELGYEATVVVLETDADGQPIRERHEGVKLTFERPDQSGSLFDENVAFEVHRARDGKVEIFADGRRIGRSIEKSVAEILASQLEYTEVPALVGSGRYVEVGETWELDASLARKLLRSRGVRVIELDGPATATLESDAGGLVVRYRIPVAWWKPSKLPANASTARTDARFEGTIRLASEARPLQHASRLVANANGVVTATGYAVAAPWNLATASSSDQSTRIVRRSVAANF